MRGGVHASVELQLSIVKPAREVVNKASVWDMDDGGELLPMHSYKTKSMKTEIPRRGMFAKRCV